MDLRQNAQNLYNQGQQAQQQGTDLYNKEAAQSTQLQGQATSDRAQAQQSLQNLQNFNVQSGGDLYSKYLTAAQQQYGFDPKALSQANQNLFKTQVAMNQAPQAAAQGGNYYGATAGQTEAGYQNLASNLGTTLANQNAAVGQYQNLLSAAQTQAGAQTGAETTTQGQQLDKLDKAATDAANLYNVSSTVMANIEQIVAQQGQWTAAAVDSYNQAAENQAKSENDFQQAQLASSQAAYAASQTTGQNIANQAAQLQLDTNKKAAGQINYNKQTGLVQFSDGAGNPLSLGQYAKTYNYYPIDLLKKAAQSGDTFAAAAVNFVGNDGKPNPGQLTGISQVIVNGKKVNVPNSQIYNTLFGTTYGYDVNQPQSTSTSNKVKLPPTTQFGKASVYSNPNDALFAGYGVY